MRDRQVHPLRDHDAENFQESPVVGEIFENVNDSRDIVQNTIQKVSGVDIRRTVAQCFNDGKVRFHLHFRGHWDGESKEADLCAVYERPVDEVPIDYLQGTSGPSGSRLLNGSGDDRDEFVFVGVVNVSEHPQEMFSRVQSIIRLQLLDKCLRVNWQPGDSSSCSMAKRLSRIGNVVNRKLSVPVVGYRSAECFGQLPDEMVKSGSGIVNAISDQQPPVVLWQWLSNRDIETALRSVHVEFCGNRVGFRVEKGTNLIFVNVQMMIGPVDF
jgi:hypothetical protein